MARGVPMSSGYIPITCVCCDRPGFHVGRGLIGPCYHRHTHAGTLHHYPSVRGDAQWRATRVVVTDIPPLHVAEPHPRLRAAACTGHDPELFFPVPETDLPQVS